MTKCEPGGSWRCALQMSAAVVLVLFATGCLHRHKTTPASRVPPPAPAPTSAGRVPATPPQPTPTPATPAPAAPIVQGERGIASWYGYPYHGRATSSGEIYNMYAMTAAHRTLPFGTEVRVHDLENGRDVTVRINDRGPFVEGRIIDLSYAAAQAMGMNGVAQVWLELLGLGPTTVPGIFAVQIGAFSDRHNAERLKALLGTQYGPVIIQAYERADGTFYRVRVGSESSEDAARQLAQKLLAANLAVETFVVRMN